MTKLSKKWICITALFTFMVSAVIAWMPLYTAFVDWYLCAQCRDWLNGDLQRKSIAYIDGKWIIEAPEVANAMNVGGVTFKTQAERLELSYAFHPLSWELDLVILVANPKITVMDSKVDWDNLIVDRKGMTPLIRINPKIFIANGEVDFPHGKSLFRS